MGKKYTKEKKSIKIRTSLKANICNIKIDLDRRTVETGSVKIET